MSFLDFHTRISSRHLSASRIGGLPYVVDDGKTGLLVEPGDADELAVAIERLLGDECLCQQMGQAARQKFQQEYIWDVIISRHYRRMLGDPEERQTSRPSALTMQQREF